MAGTSGFLLKSPRYGMRLATIVFLAVLFVTVKTSSEQAGPRTRLVGRAVLPADTFSLGPTSGQFINPVNRRRPPFVSQQPVQGFSAVLRDEDGRFLVVSDNGFGNKGNSADYVLRVYRIRPDFRTANGGTGRIIVESHFSLRDPDRKIGFPIVADYKVYSEGKGGLPVDPLIRSQRLLTGADFDIESFCKATDGTFYFGDEFGPFLLHTDDTGRLLEPPIPLPGVRSPDYPLLGSAAANLPRSRGFEGMAFDPLSNRLLPMLEGSLKRQEGQLNIYSFDIAKGIFTHEDPLKPAYRYRLDPGADAIGDITMVSGTICLVIERDSRQGPMARFKKVFRIDLGRTDGDGFLVKTEVADLLDIADPDNISGSGKGRFTFPFWTIEGVVAINRETLGIVNDNNYPFSVGRHASTTGEPDDSEFILVRVDKLW